VHLLLFFTLVVYFLGLSYIVLYAFGHLSIYIQSFSNLPLLWIRGGLSSKAFQGLTDLALSAIHIPGTQDRGNVDNVRHSFWGFADVEAIKNAWAAIPQASINNQINMSKRIQDILDANGGPTGN
jgi:hypothetical protein